jgi:hypothetical protein
MIILAIEKKITGSVHHDLGPFLTAQAHRVWERYLQGIIREIYFRQDWPGAVLVLECESADQAWKEIASLPLVKGKLIDIDIIPFQAYPGFARLFAADCKS